MPRYMPSTGDVCIVKALPKAGKCEITPAGLDMESKAPWFHSTAGMMLRSHHTRTQLFLAPWGLGLQMTGASEVSHTPVLPPLGALGRL